MGKIEFIVDKMLEGLSKEGFSPEELKATVITFLEPYFEDKAILHQCATHDQILSIFSYIVLYYSDEIFTQSMMDIINCYRKAYLNNSNKVEDIIISTADIMGQKENLMWTVKSNTPNKVSEDIHEATYTYMKHIGDCLEIGLKYRIFELCAMVEISCNHSIDYGNILNTNFGAAIQRLIDKNMLDKILITEPNGIKISDWRNIAYHHTYDILDNNIICKYGKKGYNFIISLDELRAYAGKIIKVCNIVDLARRIFLFDNNKIFANHLNEDTIHVCDRETMKIGQLKTSMLSQGFKLIDCQVKENNIIAHIQDLKRCGTLTDDEKTQREIHCTQFLYNIWTKFEADIVIITYYDNTGKKLYEYSINNNVCQNIATGKLEFMNLFRFISIKKLF